MSCLFESVLCSFSERIMSSTKTKEIKLEDQTFFPAQIDGYPLVYKNPDFKLVRR